MVEVLEQNQVANSYEEERNKPMPSLNHAKLQRNVLINLCNQYEDTYEFLPEISIKIDNWGAVPDVAIYSKQLTNFQHDTIKMDIAPLCAIEILSPMQSLSELLEKSEHYFLKGSKSYWLVIPEFENIYVYEQPYNYTIFRKTEILKDNNLGIEMDLKKIFK
jgi:Uma2 family endonuclease